MGELTDPRPLARVATIVVAVWVASELRLHVLLFRALTNLSLSGVGYRAHPEMIGLAGLFQLLSYLLNAVVVGRWIWRTNRNAHILAEGMSVTSGWAVGWFFVPVANLWKPFEGLKETWQVSHDPANWPLVSVPALLRWWWGLWVGVNLGRNAEILLGSQSITLGPPGWVDAVVTFAGVGHGLLLIPFVLRLSAAQAKTISAYTFA